MQGLLTNTYTTQHIATLIRAKKPSAAVPVGKHSSEFFAFSSYMSQQNFQPTTTASPGLGVGTRSTRSSFRGSSNLAPAEPRLSRVLRGHLHCVDQHVVEKKECPMMPKNFSSLQCSRPLGLIWNQYP